MTTTDQYIRMRSYDGTVEYPDEPIRAGETLYDAARRAYNRGERHSMQIINSRRIAGSTHYLDFGYPLGKEGNQFTVVRTCIVTVWE